jgi:hypothetical protein
LIERNAAVVAENDLVGRLRLAQRIRSKHESAKQMLIAAGRSREQVEQWPHMQVALMHSLGDVDALYDKLFKRQSFPYWQIVQEPKRRQASMPAPKMNDHDEPAIRLRLEEFELPRLLKVLESRARLDRQFAALRGLEAIRLYAAEHKGQLPAKLEEIKNIPIPVCPVTGQPFAYRRTGENTAILSAPSAQTVAPSLKPLSYELTLRH